MLPKLLQEIMQLPLNKPKENNLKIYSLFLFT